MDEFKQADERLVNDAFGHKSLTKDEVAMFEKLRCMEAVHNEVGGNLGSYKDHILELRNTFLDFLAKKYGIENRREVTYDPATQKIVSIYHPNLKAHKIVSSEGNAFKLAVAHEVVGLIKKATDLFNATEKRG